MLWGLSQGGEQGARQVLEIFRRELDLAFALTGERRLKYLYMFA